MPIINVTQADIQKSKVLDQGWYKAMFVRCTPIVPSKDQKSGNVTVTFLIEDHDGKEVDHMFNSKGWILLPQMYEAIFGSPMGEGSFEFESCLNKKLDVELFVDNYNGRLQNKIRGFLPYGKGQNQPAF